MICFIYSESELEKGSLQWVKKSESPSGSEENGHVVWVTAKPTACQKLLDEAEKIDHFSDKFGEVFLDAFMEADNGCYEMAKGILNTFYECETDRDFQIANHMLMGICGYTAETLLERIEKRESEDLFGKAVRKEDDQEVGCLYCMSKKKKNYRSSDGISENMCVMIRYICNYQSKRFGGYHSEHIRIFSGNIWE